MKKNVTASGIWHWRLTELNTVIYSNLLKANIASDHGSIYRKSESTCWCPQQSLALPCPQTSEAADLLNWRLRHSTSLETPPGDAGVLSYRMQCMLWAGTVLPELMGPRLQGTGILTGAPIHPLSKRLLLFCDFESNPFWLRVAKMTSFITCNWSPTGILTESASHREKSEHLLFFFFSF